jgi:hypothetical protein
MPVRCCMHLWCLLLRATCAAPSGQCGTYALRCRGAVRRQARLGRRAYGNIDSSCLLQTLIFMWRVLCPAAGRMGVLGLGRWGTPQGASPMRHGCRGPRDAAAARSHRGVVAVGARFSMVGVHQRGRQQQQQRQRIMCYNAGAAASCALAARAPESRGLRQRRSRCSVPTG